MQTCTIQIGNSDDRLSHVDWASFQADTAVAVSEILPRVYFSGSSDPLSQWQNRCFVGDIDESKIMMLGTRLELLCRRYNQVCIAVTIGNTAFVKPNFMP